LQDHFSVPLGNKLAMILSELGRYLAQRRRASIDDLALHFRAEPEALRGMLAMLEKKGRLRRVGSARACGGSSCCCSAAIGEVYEWADGGAGTVSGCATARPAD
jgi:putative ferrous iron transport protein C